MTYYDAYSYIVDFLHRKPEPPGGYRLQGCDLTITAVIRTYLMEREGMIGNVTEYQIRELSPPFYEAAWDLARRGIIRPGPRYFGATEPSGGGFSLTSRGAEWVTQAVEKSIVAPEPGRFNELIARFRDTYGEAFYERGVESTLCYEANAFLACCVMCGAAAESVLLTLAIEKLGDEERVMAMYKTAAGRGRIEAVLINHLNQYAREEFKGFTQLINYWRSEGAHGAPSHLGEVEAFLARERLLRFAHYCQERWRDLTGK